jgi:ParB family chromosome partitioning protein
METKTITTTPTATEIPARLPTRARTWTGDVEWYTPANILAAAAEAMGGIDLDPASSHAQQAVASVKAGRYFTITDDSLEQPWRDRVFCNPPYARGWIDLFVEKMVAEYRAGRVSQGVLLTNSATETKWWQVAFNNCNAVCFHTGRIRFFKVGADGKPTQGTSSPSHPHSLFYFGADVAQFKRVFRELGVLAVPDH